MNLKQKLIKEAMQEAGQKIATIDRNSGLIAECEALATQLRLAGDVDAIAMITVHDDSVTARVSFYGHRVSDVLQAICNAGLTATETPIPDYLKHNTASRTFKIAGLDVPINISDPIAELAEAA